ncbi:MAG: TraB/GumN family protein [Geobacteraceae bacterium]|nr:TraB/GumN family protein [Geobacteraceae bacterium]
MVGKFLGGILACAVTLLLLASWGRAAENAGAGEKSFLWKVQAKAGIVYLFGSVHLARSDSYPLSRSIEESFAKAETLALEADPGRALAAETQQRLVLSAIYPGNDTLRQHLSKETYDLAVRELERLGIPIEPFARAKPWFLAMTIGVLELQQLGYSPEHGFDLYFAGKARGEKKIIELESFDYQINLLNSFGDREQELFLLYTIKDLAQAREGMDELMRAWRTGDTQEMEKIVGKPLSDFPEIRPIYEKLYYQRNRTMAGRIEQLLQAEGSTFVVVGAAHLVGKEGIVELLKRKGYRVEQM